MDMRIIPNLSILPSAIAKRKHAGSAETGVGKAAVSAEPEALVLRQPCVDGSGGRGWTERSEGSPGVSGYRPPTPATHQAMADRALADSSKEIG